MLNRLQRILLIIGTAVSMVAVMFFIGSTQQLEEYKQATRQALEQVEGKTLVYIDPDPSATDTIGFATIDTDTFTMLAESLDGEMLYTPIAEPFSPFPIGAPGSNEANKETTLLGANENYTQVVDALLLNGSFFTAQDVKQASPVCVVSQGFLDYNGLTFSPGMELMLGNISVTVSGVISFPDGNIDGLEVFKYVPNNGLLVVVPITLLPTLSDDFSDSIYANYIVGRQPDNGEGMTGKQFAEYINKRLADNQLLQTTVYNSYSILAVSAAELQKVWESDNTMTVTVGVAIATLLLLIAGINIVQLVLAAIQDNQQRIALKMAVGARVRNIGWELLRELLIINLKGGYIGIALSGICIALMNNSTGTYYLSFDIWSLLFGFIAILVLSILSLILPFISLTRLQPAQAIREGKV